MSRQGKNRGKKQQCFSVGFVKEDANGGGGQQPEKGGKKCSRSAGQGQVPAGNERSDLYLSGGGTSDRERPKGERRVELKTGEVGQLFNSRETQKEKLPGIGMKHRWDAEGHQGRPADQSRQSPGS